MNHDTIIAGLAALQADGLACMACGADYLRVRGPHVQVGRSVTGSQVFACVGYCPDDVRRATGGGLR
ncbi:hypothetical protein ACFS2C_08870 [Prauserella oleivorans]|uniref:Uncharacterized protein n=1 Tax=Prauserella oleivorans TaxID=1478153 RepID=A0ABW5W6G3_9PSEU